MPLKEKQGQDIESDLIQKMSEMCERFDNQNKKNFLTQLLDSAPSVFITIVGLAITFYIYVNVELSKINQSAEYQNKAISEIHKTMTEVRDDIKGIDRRIYSLEIKQPK